MNDPYSSSEESLDEDRCWTHDLLYKFRCLNCRKFDLCEKCIDEFHRNHFVEPLLTKEEEHETFIVRLERFKKKEKKEILDSISKHYDDMKKWIVAAEKETKFEVEKAYFDQIKSLKTAKPLSESCQDEVMQKSWAKVEFPSFVVVQLSHDQSIEPKKGLTVVPRKFDLRFDKNSDERQLFRKDLKATKLSLRKDDEVRIVGKVNSPDDFNLQRLDDFPKMKEMYGKIHGLLAKDELIEVEADKDLEKGAKILIPDKNSIHFHDVSKIKLLRAEVISCQGKTIKIKQIDYNRICEHNRQSVKIYYGPEEIFDSSNYPIFVVKCQLFNVSPINGDNWDQIAAVILDSWRDRSNLQVRLIEDAKNNVATVDLYHKKPNDSIETYLTNHLELRGIAKFTDKKKLRNKKSFQGEKFQYSAIHPCSFDEGSVMVVNFTSTEEVLKTLWFQVLKTNNAIYDVKIEMLLKDMKKFYEEQKDNENLTIDVPRVNQPCAVYVEEKGAAFKYFRGKILKVEPGSINDDDSKGSLRLPKVLVRLVDLGSLHWKTLKEVKILPGKFVQLPEMALKARLSHIEPSQTKEALKAFDDLTKSVNDLYLSIDKKTSKGELEVVLFSSTEEKLVNLNAVFVWQGFAKLKDIDKPFCQRIEYFRRNPLELLLDEGAKKVKMPIFSNANVTMEFCKNEEKLQHCSVANYFVRNEEVILFLRIRSEFEPDMNELMEEMKEAYLETPSLANIPEDELPKELGELCVVKRKVGNDEEKLSRARIYSLNGDNVESLLLIDSGEIIEMEETIKLMPLFSNFRSDLDHIPVPYKMRLVKVDSNSERTFKEALKRLIKEANGGNLFFFKPPKQSFQVVPSLAFFNLDFKNLPEVDLIGRMNCNVKAFSEGTLYYFDLGLLLAELGLAKTTKSLKFDLLPMPQWKEAILPAENNYHFQRSFNRSEEFINTDFQAIITCVDLDGTFFLQRDSTSTLTSVNQEIDDVYIFSRPKIQDEEWYEGEACIAKFDHDKKWYRARFVKRHEILFEVNFVDFGNNAYVSQDNLRKDLIGLDVPIQCFRTKIHGIELTDKYNGYDVHEQFCGTKVHVELIEPPTKFPLEVNLYLSGYNIQTEDIASIFLRKEMAKEISY